MSTASLRTPFIVTAIAALSAVFAIIRVFALPGINIADLHYKVFPDTFWLIRDAFLFTGSSIEDATRKGLEIYLPLANGPIIDINAGVTANLPVYLSISPRYTAIFESRPFASLVLAPFISAFGATAIGWVIAAEVAIAGFLSAVLATRLAKTTLAQAPVLAVLALTAFFVLPTGEWGSAVLFEGFSYIFAIAAVILAVIILQRSNQAQVAIWLLAPVALLGLAAKSSMLTPVLVIAMFPFAWRVFQARGRDTLMNWAVGILAGSLALWSLLGAMLKWPGVTESLQDTFTDHFNRPDVSNPIQLWWNLLKTSAMGEVHWAIDNPAIPIALIIVLLLAIQRFGLTSIFLLGFVASGLGQFFIHPEPSEFERLFAVAWLAVAVAAPMLLLELFEHNRAKARSGRVSWAPDFTRH
ncbi:MAG: hypothetical protein ACOYBP_05035 [Microbacteriaceae bacterium]